MKKLNYIIYDFFERGNWPYLYYVKSQEELEVVKSHNKDIKNYFSIKTNFDSDKVSLVIYDAGAGGNFLVNLLSLSSNVLSQYNTFEGRVKAFVNWIQGNTSAKWQDLHLSEVYRVDKHKERGKDQWFFIIDHFLQSNNKTVEVNSIIEYHLSAWPNCKKIIKFKNSNLFCFLRRCVWSKTQNGEIIYDKFPQLKNGRIVSDSFSLTLGDYFDFDEEKKTYLKEKYRNAEQEYDYCELDTKREIYFWDTEWYLSEEETVINIKRFYDYFDFPVFNDRIIRTLYKLWIAKLIELRGMDE